MSAALELPAGDYEVAAVGPSEERGLTEDDLGAIILNWDVSVDLNSGRRTGRYSRRVVHRIVGPADASYYKNHPDAGDRLEISVAGIWNDKIKVRDGRLSKNRQGEMYRYRSTVWMPANDNVGHRCKHFDKPIYLVQRSTLMK